MEVRKSRTFQPWLHRAMARGRHVDAYTRPCPCIMAPSMSAFPPAPAQKSNDQVVATRCYQVTTS